MLLWDTQCWKFWYGLSCLERHRAVLPANGICLCDSRFRGCVALRTRSRNMHLSCYTEEAVIITAGGALPVHWRVRTEGQRPIECRVHEPHTTDVWGSAREAINATMMDRRSSGDSHASRDYSLVLNIWRKFDYRFGKRLKMRGAQRLRQSLMSRACNLLYCLRIEREANQAQCSGSGMSHTTRRQPTVERTPGWRIEQWSDRRGGKSCARGCHQGLRGFRDEETAGRDSRRMGLARRGCQPQAAQSETLTAHDGVG